MPSQRTLLYRGRIVDLGLETVELPNSQQVSLEIVRHPGGAVIAAIDDESRICLVRQYRHAAGDFIWEVPAGKLDSGEPPLATAQRELKEEAGVLAEKWSDLGVIYSTPGFCDERLHLYLAQNLTLTSYSPQPDEHIQVHWLSFEKALKWALIGQIQDAKTLAILFRAAMALGWLQPRKSVESKQKAASPDDYHERKNP